MRGPHKYVFCRFEENFMRAHYQKLTNKELADMLGHRRTLVRTKCYDLGLKRMEMEYWTDEQIAFLEDNYQQYGDTELTELFTILWHKDKGWSKKHIEKKRRYLNLKRSSDQKSAVHKRNVENGCFADCPVKRWQTIGVTPIFGRKVWEHQSGRPFLVIKLKDGFVHYAPWLWEQIYGPIPQGMCVRTKDNNPINIKPGNLMLVTRAEHALINKRNAVPEEYKEINNLIHQINKTIYGKQRQSN